MGRFVLIFLLFSIPFMAVPWGLSQSIHLPWPDAKACASLGALEFIFILTDGNPPMVYKYYVPIQSIMNSFPAPGGPGASGIAFDGHDYIYVGNYNSSYIYKTNTTGSLLSSFKCPFDGPGDLDRKYDGPINNMYIPFPDLNIIAVIDTTGSLISTVPGPGTRAIGATGYGTFFVTDTETHYLYANGSPIWNFTSPTGLGMTFDLSVPVHYWVYVIDDATDTLYVISNADAGVEPVSFSRVKALFK